MNNYDVRDRKPKPLLIGSTLGKREKWEEKNIDETTINHCQIDKKCNFNQKLCYFLSEQSNPKFKMKLLLVLAVCIAMALARKLKTFFTQFFGFRKNKMGEDQSRCRQGSAETDQK